MCYFLPKNVRERKRDKRCARPSRGVPTSIASAIRTVMYSRLNSEEWLSNRLTPSAPAASSRNESPGLCPSTEEGKDRKKTRCRLPADGFRSRARHFFQKERIRERMPRRQHHSHLVYAASYKRGCWNRTPPPSAASGADQRAKLTRSYARPRRPILEKDR